MRVFGSLTNRMQEESKPATPTVGMGATELMYSDRKAYTVIEVSDSGKTCKAQSDTATRTDKNGMSESQTYRYEPNPDGEVITLRINKRGQWVHSGTVFRMGERDAYHDYSY